MNVRGCEYTVFVSPLCVPELTALKEGEEGLSIGASCSLTQIADKMKELVDQLPCEYGNIM